MERVGYIYFSDHASGSYLGWPAVEWCQADDYDPRLRPWPLGCEVASVRVVLWRL